MSETPEQIRARIDRTRNELSSDVDALADKVSPTKAMHRQTNKMKAAATSVKERVFGAAEDAGDSASGAMSSAADSLHDAKDRAVAKAEGNPLAVGLIAFGAGMLLSSLIPASEKEKELASDLKEQAEPLIDEAKSVAQTMADDLKGPAQDAAESMKESVASSVEHVKEEGAAAADTVKSEAEQSRQNVMDQRDS